MLLLIISDIGLLLCIYICIYKYMREGGRMGEGDRVGGYRGGGVREVRHIYIQTASAAQ